MMENTTLQDLQRMWEEASRKIQILEKELTKHRAEQAACELIISIHTVKGKTAERSKLHHAHILPSQLINCTTHEEAFLEIAQRSHGIVRMSEAGRLVHAAGLSKGKASSIVSSMSTRLESSDSWEWLAPGTYRLLTYTGTDIRSPEPNDNDTGDEQWPAELYPTDDEDTSSHIYPTNGETEAKVSE